MIADSKDAMVICRELLSALGITITFSDQTVQWDERCLQVNTGGMNGIKSDTLDTEYAEEYKELSNSGVDPKELVPNHLTAELFISYMELLENNPHLYDDHLGRMRFDDYILPLSPE